MRIPIPIVILCCINTLGVVWYAGTRDKDFLSAPTPEELTQIAKEWKENSPNIRPSEPINASLLKEPVSETPQTPAEEENGPEEIIDIPAAELLYSPALSEYSTMASDKGTNTLIKLATLLETKGELQRALLAWERVIDTTDPGKSQRLQATKAIQRLKPTLPAWNPDPESEVIITLHAGATIKNKAILVEVLNKVAQTINESSGFILRVKTNAAIGEANNAPTTRIPVAIWFSRDLDDQEASAGTTPIAFIASDITEEKSLIVQLETTVYALVRKRLKSFKSFSALPEYNEADTSDALLQLQITRMMWREFASSLKQD